jgi:hypothetical protein
MRGAQRPGASRPFAAGLRSKRVAACLLSSLSAPTAYRRALAGEQGPHQFRIWGPGRHARTGRRLSVCIMGSSSRGAKKVRGEL